MKNRKRYTAIAAIVIGTNLYSLFWILKIALRPSFHIRYNIQSLLFSFPTCIALTGGILFLSSGFRRSSLLRIYMCYVVISFPLWQLGKYLYFRQQPDDSPLLQQPILYYIGTIISVIEFLVSCLGLWFIGKDRVLKTSYNAASDKPVLQFFPASKEKRFINRLLDLTIIIFILFNSVIENYYFSHSNFANSFGDEDPAFIFEIVLALFFYLVLEGIFKTTPGKCATNTIIVDEDGKTASFRQMAGRTLSRLIPFEAFSFLGSTGRGWHDTISETYVAESVYVENTVEKKQDFDVNEPDYLAAFYKTRSSE